MIAKADIINCLRAFIEQRPGIDPRNYGSWRDYRSESRSVTRDLHIARTLLQAVEWRESITADMLMNASRSAFSGRLTIQPKGETGVQVDYCVGQYFPTEFRKAAAAVCAQALWHWTANSCMPSAIIKDGEKTYPHAPGHRNTVSGGEWLRSHFRREFGRSIANVYFD